MKEIKREPQPEHWWKARTCPTMSTRTRKMCDGKDCALWVETRKDGDGKSTGVCTG